MTRGWLGLAVVALSVIAGPVWPGEGPGQGVPRIRIQPESFDFGRALPGRSLSKEFSLRNVGDRDLVIERVATSCGCTGAIAGETRLKPGRATTLTVTLQTRSDRGRIERSIVVVSNDPKTPSASVTVSATVEPAK